MDALAASGISPESLELELTELLLLEDEYDIKGQISRLAAQGVSFSVDDFGKGYSNLGNLGKFDVAIAEDRPVLRLRDVRQCPGSGAGRSHCAHGQGARPQDRRRRRGDPARAASMLSLFGVDSGQGYYWSQPLPMDDFIGYLDDCEGGKAKSA